MNFDPKVPLLPVILAAFCIMLAIRVSGLLLPAGYYFSVSSIFKNDESMMLVSAPGIAGKKLCQLLKKNKLELSDLDINHACTNAIVNEKIGTWGKTLAARDREQIYAMWLANVDQIEKTINDVLATPVEERNRKVAFLEKKQLVAQEEEFETTVEDDDVDPDSKNDTNTELMPNPSLNIFAKDFPPSAASSALSGVALLVENQIEPLFASIVEKLPSPDEQADDEAVELTGIQIKLSPSQLASVMKNSILQAQIAISKPNNFERSSYPERKEAVETILKMSGPKTIISDIVAYHLNPWYGTAEDVVTDFLNANGVPTKVVEQNLREVKKAIVWENLPRYVVAATIRVAVVFVTVLGLAFLLLGRYSIASFSLGGALAAFLLVWPVIVLWDVAVNLDWQSLRVQFFLVYIVYILAFFFTARAAAQLAVRVRTKFGHIVARQDEIVGSGVNVTLREIVGSISVAMVFHVISFGAGILIPLAGNG